MKQAEDRLLMSILRVEQDGIEFFTEALTGHCWMSESGLARLCGISQQGMRKKIQALLTTKSTFGSLKDFAGKKVSRQLTLKINGLQVNVSLLPSDFCAAIIEYYAFESRHKTETAMIAYRKFARKGIDAWIQGITGWTPTLSESKRKIIKLTPEKREEIAEEYIQSILEEGFIAATINPEAVITILRDSKFKTAGLKLYFYLEMMHIQGIQPEVSQICSDLNISVASFRRWLPEVHEWSRCADWLELKHRQGPEREIQLRLHAELGGTMEAYTPMGPVDLVTKTEVIEIKRIADWKTALGQIFAKAYMFPDKHKRIHLFGDSSQQLKKITNHCRELDVTVTFENYL